MVQPLCGQKFCHFNALHPPYIVTKVVGLQQTTMGMERCKQEHLKGQFNRFRQGQTNTTHQHNNTWYRVGRVQGRECFVKGKATATHTLCAGGFCDRFIVIPPIIDCICRQWATPLISCGPPVAGNGIIHPIPNQCSLSNPNTFEAGTLLAHLWVHP